MMMLKKLVITGAFAALAGAAMLHDAPAGTQTPQQSTTAAVPEAPLTGVVQFDYSTHDGTYKVGSGDKLFGIKFSKASNESIHLYNDDASIDKIARVKNAAPGQEIRFSDYDSTSRAYTIQTGETFMMRNKQGYHLQGRIRLIRDDSRGDAADQVVFEYQINPDKCDSFKALPLQAAQVAPAPALKP